MWLANGFWVGNKVHKISWQSCGWQNSFGWEIKSIKYLGKVVGGKIVFGWEIVKVVGVKIVFGWEIKSIKYLGKVVGGKIVFGWEMNQC